MATTATAFDIPTALGALEKLSLPSHDSVPPQAVSGIAWALKDLRYAARFQNPICTCTIQDGVLQISPTLVTTNFLDLQSLRAPQRNLAVPLADTAARLERGEAVTLANVGVSVWVETEIAGERYALLQARRTPGGGIRNMLFSGYVDMSGYLHFQKSAPDLAAVPPSARGAVGSQLLRETGEEFLAVDSERMALMMGHYLDRGRDMPLRELVLGRGSEFLRGNGDAVEGVSLGELHAELPYDPHLAWPLRPALEAPVALQNWLPVREVRIGGDALNVKAQYSHDWNALQVFKFFKLELPPDLRGLSAFNAEDALVMLEGLDGRSPIAVLQNVVRADGTVLWKLNAETGRFTGESFWLLEGRLVPRLLPPAEEVVFSEAFSAPKRDESGVVRSGVPAKTEVSLAEMLRMS